ncbi:MAG TPA: LysM peptidoglycan-binding domain-containing protein, partial [Elusimicrobiota bacterium]|nr:LysM peptidoglycan-binding domain-containing protein [Elusimicrobiota bacterium]
MISHGPMPNSRKKLLFIVLLSFSLLASVLIPPVPLQGAEALQEIIVKPGDTLWGIANYYLKDPKRWPELLKYNKQLTNNPTVALPGMRLLVPVVLIKEQLRAAELIYLLKDVRTRRKSSNEWKTAKVGMELHNEDGLRTMSESIARIKFPSGEVVSLNENSLVLIRPEKGEEYVQLMAGDVRARQSRVITAGGAQVTPLGPDSDYRTRVKLDKSELVLVYRGRVDVTAQGKTVRVPEGFGSEIKPLMPPADPVPLPQIPLVQSADMPMPKNMDITVKTQQTERDLVLAVEIPQTKDVGPKSPTTSAEARLQAKAVSRSHTIARYHIQVDDADNFQNPIVDKYAHLSQKFNLLQLGLPNGTYWWRISFIDSLGMEGSFSEPKTFEVDLSPPNMVITYPAEFQEFPWDEE